MILGATRPATRPKHRRACPVTDAGSPCAACENHRASVNRLRGWTTPTHRAAKHAAPYREARDLLGMRVWLGYRPTHRRDVEAVAA